MCDQTEPSPTTSAIWKGQTSMKKGRKKNYAPRCGERKPTLITAVGQCAVATQIP
ncbi:Hypothetical protein FKW44_016366 [Caligus rogercresseyi]|uniref:Uncharacterized protein n=1 Tax=Caligus rogercresseyi TaxID=217165 RepID=A0A7T8H2C5_CALRO|nr:Hypothetical protein FKW44_016366 [Caligus rogercresseyi]